MMTTLCENNSYPTQALPRRKPTRWSEINYSAEGFYFITICTQNRQQNLSSIVGEGLAPPVIQLSIYGKIAEEQLLSINAKFPQARITAYTIMPNHIHLILHLQKTGGASPSPTVSSIIGAFKSLTTRLCNQTYKIGKLFQRSFHDHVIRNEHEYAQIADYIAKNPQTWHEDCFYSDPSV